MQSSHYRYVSTDPLGMEYNLGTAILSENPEGKETLLRIGHRRKNGIHIEKKIYKI
jgi:hypothetical protein